MSPRNDPLRQHVTRVAFTLTLYPTHIATLVALDYGLRHDDYDGSSWVTMLGPWDRSFILGVRGVEDRGLVLHKQCPSCPGMGGPPHRPRQPTSDHWSITDAGYAAITLLKESGLWAEYAQAIGGPIWDEIAPPPRHRRSRKRVVEDAP